MTTLASNHVVPVLPSRSRVIGGTWGEVRPRRLWPVVALIAAVVLAVAPLYLEVLVMHARLAAAEQSMDRIVGRMSTVSVHAAR